MIVVKLQGGTANQLFQWALYKLFESKGFDSYLDISFFNRQNFRSFELDKFENLKFKINPTEPIGIFQEIIDDFIYRDMSLLDKNKNYLMNGYWQSEKYFLEIESLIREELYPSNEKIFELLDKYKLNILNNSVSIHVRRTDYVNSQKYHPLQTIEYYNNALNILKGQYEHILVFSDDIGWCKDNLNWNNTIFVSDNSNVDDLYLMSMCKHNIIANSSFSWWGAWLNTNPDKKVIYPSNWFGEYLNLPTNDLLPSDWIKI